MRPGRHARATAWCGTERPALVCVPKAERPMSLLASLFSRKDERAPLRPLYAALIFAGAFLLLALAVYLGARIGERRHKRQLVDRRRASETGTLLATAAVTALPVMLKAPLPVKLGLPLAGLVALALMRDDDADEG